MFRIKICGLTTIEDAQAVATAGADAVGFNFHAGSTRCTNEKAARQIIAALPLKTVKVGVFVNAPAAEINGLFDRLGLDLIQLHGDEPPEFLIGLGGRPIVRAFRAGADLQPIADYLSHCQRLGTVPKMVLVDAFQAGTFGGTGHTADWASLAAGKEIWGELPLILAGGLNAGNVAAAIQQVHPAAVDTASGVESAPGRKSPQQVQAFVAAAKAAFASCDPDTVSTRS